MARIQKSCAVTQKENAVQKALNHAQLAPKEIYLKEKGVVKENFRVALRELASCNVPVKKIGVVLEKAIGGKGNGAEGLYIQLAYEIKESKGITLSGDGTNIWHLNVESQHGSWEAEDYSGQSEGKRQVVRTFGILMAVDHTSKTQFHSWKCRGAEFIATYNASKLGKKNPMDIWMFAAAIIGLMTDHAADQKKLARFLLQWKLDAIRVLEGRKFMEDAALQDLLPGMNTLTEEEQQNRDVETCEMLCAQFGETVWNGFLEEIQRVALLFVWAGCCMHKDQNWVKYGAERMAKFWEEQNLTGPVKLMNRANAAAAGDGPLKSQENAVKALQGGAVKLTSLAGAVFQNKDDKKGQQDTYQLFFEQSLSFPMPRFPNTSSTRFGLHGKAAGKLLVYLPLFLEFLMLVCNKKENRYSTIWRAMFSRAYKMSPP
ncbi:hypothetical protein B0H34DRAFT_794780 [Crassisporium funariophilum]|nr:hypothetical protein B0H34DRAFT_794780 [Crassisporium funariophilum]